MNSRAVSYGFYQGSRNCIYKYMFFDLSNREAEDVLRDTVSSTPIQ